MVGYAACTRKTQSSEASIAFGVINLYSDILLHQHDYKAETGELASVYPKLVLGRFTHVPLALSNTTAIEVRPLEKSSFRAWKSNKNIILQRFCDHFVVVCLPRQPCDV